MPRFNLKAFRQVAHPPTKWALFVPIDCAIWPKPMQPVPATYLVRLFAFVRQNMYFVNPAACMGSWCGLLRVCTGSAPLAFIMIDPHAQGQSGHLKALLLVHVATTFHADEFNQICLYNACLPSRYKIMPLNSCPNGNCDTPSATTIASRQGSPHKVCAGPI